MGREEEGGGGGNYYHNTNTTILYTTTKKVFKTVYRDRFLPNPATKGQINYPGAQPTRFVY